MSNTNPLKMEILSYCATVSPFPLSMPQWSLARKSRVNSQHVIPQTKTHTHYMMDG